MRQADGEFDYLVGTKLSVDPDSFDEVVKEVFALELGLRRSGDIAEILGVNKSRISQILNDPENLKPETIRAILRHLKLPTSRRRVLKAWNKAAFGNLGERNMDSLLGEVVDDSTIRKIDRMVRQSRMSMAANLASEAFRKATKRVLQEQALDRLYFCRQRLDQPGQAIGVARKIIDRARKREEPLREGAGHLFRARTLIGLASCKPEEFERILEEAENLLLGDDAPESWPYTLGKRSHLNAYRRNSRLVFMERGLMPVNRDYLDGILNRTLAEAHSGETFQSKFHAWLSASRIYLLMGETFSAREAVDRAYQCGSLKNLNIYEMSGIIVGRVNAATDGPDTAIEYLETVGNYCQTTEDNYHRRLVEWEIAKLHNDAITD